MTLEAKYTFEAIGTAWSVETETPLSDQEKRYIANEVASFSHAYSRFDPQSLVSRLGEVGASVRFPRSIKEIISFYQTLYEATAGKVNPLVGGSLEQLGYDQSYSLVPSGASLPAPPLASLRLNDTTVSLQTPAVLDIGAAGKGYLVDQIAQYVGLHHTNYVIDGSGDMLVHTTTPQTIGLEHPADASRVIGSIDLTHGSLAASAPNRRAWGKGLHHIIDATTGTPADTHIVATWVVASTAMIADGLATALFFTEPDRLQQYTDDFRYVIMTKDGNVQHNIATIGKIYT